MHRVWWVGRSCRCCSATCSLLWPLSPPSSGIYGRLWQRGVLSANGWVLLPQVTQYLLDQSFVMDEETLYEASLRIEPKLPS